MTLGRNPFLQRRTYDVRLRETEEPIEEFRLLFRDGSVVIDRDNNKFLLKEQHV